MDYIIDGHKYTISYHHLKEEYIKHCEMNDEEFMKNLASAIHLACVICFFKEIPSYLCLNDRGIVHELAHCLHIPEGNTRNLQEIRKLFKDQLKLA